jgi:hypothetical protein
VRDLTRFAWFLRMICFDPGRKQRWCGTQANAISGRLVRYRVSARIVRNAAA